MSVLVNLVPCSLFRDATTIVMISDYNEPNGSRNTTTLRWIELTKTLTSGCARNTWKSGGILPVHAKVLSPPPTPGHQREITKRAIKEGCKEG